jgi:hypothetical protein
MKFQVNTCPLCEEDCYSHKVAGVTVFSCPTEVRNIPGSKSHYEVEIGKTEVQRVIVYPFAVDSFLDKSRVYHAEVKNNNIIWKLIMEVSLINVGEETKLLERLNTLLTFI